MTQIKYIKQKDKIGCGPVAVKNAYAWAGWGINLKHLYKEFNTEYWKGTPVSRLEKFLREDAKDIFQIKKVLVPTIEKIEKHLRNDGIILYSYYHSPVKGHYLLIDSISASGKTFGVVNAFRYRPAKAYVRRKRMEEHFVAPNFHKPTALFLTKK